MRSISATAEVVSVIEWRRNPLTENLHRLYHYSRIITRSIIRSNVTGRR